MSLMKRSFNNRTRIEIDHLVQRVAKKIGYSSAEVENDFYGKKSSKGLFSRSQGRPSAAEQFSRELTEFIYVCMEKLMDKGASEEQALLVMQDNFNNEKMADSLNEFFKEYGGMEMEREKTRQYASSISKTEVVGMFYAALVIIGISLGALIGKIAGFLATGIISGAAIGLGMGIIVHGIVILESLKNR